MTGAGGGQVILDLPGCLGSGGPFSGWNSNGGAVNADRWNSQVLPGLRIDTGKTNLSRLDSRRARRRIRAIVYKPGDCAGELVDRSRREDVRLAQNKIMATASDIPH